MTNKIDELINLSIQRAKITKCCLNCKFSYFNPLNEVGLCSNENMVKNHMWPKVVPEFFKCEHWENKK